MRPAWASRSTSGYCSAASTLVLGLALGLSAVPVTAQAGAVPLPLLVKKKKKKKKKKKDGINPEQAADRRMPIQDQGRQMVSAGELTAATFLYDGAARTHGDPVLFLDAGDVYLEIGASERDLASAETAKLRAQTAEDVLYFHLDSASDPDFRLVTDSEISGLLARATQLVDAADSLIAEITAEQEAVLAPEAAPPKAKGDGRIMRLTGLGLLGLGVAGLGVGIAGLAIGRVNQGKVDDPTVYGTEFDQFDTKGRRGNVIAGVGLALGGVALVGGAVLFVLGRSRGKTAGSSPSDDSGGSDDAGSPPEPPIVLVPTGNGIALAGRF